MRPVRLEMEGFTAFRDRTVVDFDGIDLAALVGPTGSGKSSLIDAVTFALYGVVARYDDARLVAPAISQLANEARVRFDFEAGSRTYTAVRVARRTRSGATTAEARLEAGDGVLASGPKELTAAVRDLLGLDFGQFTKTVVLPQGQFAAFLHDDPRDRQALLRELLDLGVYARMGDRARTRAATARAQLDVYTTQLAEAADVTPERVSELADRHRQVATLRADVGERLERVGALQRDVAQTRELGEALVAALHRLQAVSVSQRALELGAELAEAVERVAAAESGLARARTDRDAAQQASEVGPDASRCRLLLDAWKRHDDVVAEIGVLEGRLARAAEEAVATSRQVEDLRADLETADATYDRARAAAGAVGLISALVVGQPCPVCRQTVSALPEHDVDAELAAATTRREAAQAALAAAGELREHASRELAAVQAHVERSRRDATELEATLRDAPDAQTVGHDLEQAGTLAEALRAAANAATEAEAAERDARGGLEALRAEEHLLRSEYTAQRDGVAGLDPQPPAAGGTLIEDWTALAAWAGRCQHDVVAEAEGVRSRLGQLDDALAEEAAAIVRRCEEHGLDGRLDGLGERLLQADVRAEAAAAEMERRLAEVTKTREEAERLREQGQVAGALGRHLRADGFERWLLSEVLADLVDRATDMLLTLSGGQYSMVATADGFAIRDHRNADEVRDVRTLSGGETFLASLSLALALADSVAEMATEGAARLESIFLDEGFGTLDPDTLDVVAAAIEELGASGRMVVIVTHIRELADRMPVRFEVSKSAATSSVERVEV